MDKKEKEKKTKTKKHCFKKKENEYQNHLTHLPHWLWFLQAFAIATPETKDEEVSC